jgi:hypothetical protein
MSNLMAALPESIKKSGIIFGDKGAQDFCGRPIRLLEQFILAIEADGTDPSLIWQPELAGVQG